MKALPTKIAIFASGSGSNAEVLAKWAKLHADSVNLCGVLTDNPQAGVIARMNRIGVEVTIVTRKNRLQHEADILSVLSDWNPDWILLAGFMRILSPNFLQRFHDPVRGYYKIINIHPSALPDFPGLDACRRCFDAQSSHGGVTVHLVDEGVDTGRILAQETYPRIDGESFESFFSRGQALEHRMYLQVLKKLVHNQGVLT